MRAPEEILRIWKRFDAFPMETLTKAWWYQWCEGLPYQRSVEEMQEHRDRFGCSGNCFDLALWLLRDFEAAGIRAHAVGHDLFTPHAHIAVIAFDQDGYAYLCDLGDQWLEPILVDSRSPHFTTDFQSGFFPAAQVSVTVEERRSLMIRYRRPNGKESRQRFDTRPVPADALVKAADHSQKLLRHPLVEVRRIHPALGSTGHWEFSRGVCRWSLDTGLYEERSSEVADWVQRIHEMTGIAPAVVETAFDVYRDLGTEMNWFRR